MVFGCPVEMNGGVKQLVSTDGGRYDVDVSSRVRRAVYWEEEPLHIQRCSWFFKRERDNRYVPYPEEQAQKLEVRTFFLFLVRIGVTLILVTILTFFYFSVSSYLRVYILFQMNSYYLFI